MSLKAIDVNMLRFHIHTVIYMVLYNNAYNSVFYLFKNRINKINTAGILFILNLSKLSAKQSSKTWEMSQVSSHIRPFWWWIVFSYLLKSATWNHLSQPFKPSLLILLHIKCPIYTYEWFCFITNSSANSSRQPWASHFIFYQISLGNKNSKSEFSYKLSR